MGNFRNFRNLKESSIRVQAAKLLLYRLKDKKMLDLRGEDKIYRDAEIKFLIDNYKELEMFIFTGDTSNIRFRNHKRDKHGKLISVEAYAVHG